MFSEMKGKESQKLHTLLQTTDLSILLSINSYYCPQMIIHHRAQTILSLGRQSFF